MEYKRIKLLWALLVGALPCAAETTEAYDVRGDLVEPRSVLEAGEVETTYYCSFSLTVVAAESMLATLGYTTQENRYSEKRIEEIEGEGGNMNNWVKENPSPALMRARALPPLVEPPGRKK